MIRLSLILALALPTLLGDWSTFESPDCPFSVELPGEVSVMIDTLRSPSFSAVFYDYSARLDSTAFMASCSRIVPGLFESPDLDARLDAAALASLGDSDLAAFERTEVAGYPARRWAETIDFGDGLLVEHRLIVYTRSHQFHLATGMYTAAEDVERFFGSLRLR